MTPRSDVKETAVAGIGSWLKRLIQPFFFFLSSKGSTDLLLSSDCEESWERDLTC